MQAAPVTPEVSDESEEDDLPDRFQISRRGLSARINRGAEKKIKELGFQSFDEIQEMKAKLAEVAQREEEARLAQMSELERERELRTKSESRLQELEQTVEEERTNRIMEREQSRLERWIGEFIDPKYAKYAYQDALEAINSASLEDIADPDAFLKQTLEKYVTEKPEFGKHKPMQLAPEQPAPQAPAPKAIPMTNGTPLTRPLPAGLGFEGKTAAPGRPNSMNPQELAAYKKARGLQW
jgi:hypothetical protein